jgi:hypothetical protein
VASSRNVDSAIDHLDKALRTVGLAGLEPPNDVAPVAEIAEVVAPYGIPPELELRRFWERVDAERIPVYTFPRLGGPAAALELLNGLRELRQLGETAPSVPPPMLLPVDYASHCYGVIELGSELE